MSAAPSRWQTPWPWMGLVLALAALGVGTFLVLFRGWSEVHHTDAAGAQLRFEQARQRAAAPGPTAAPAYLNIDDGGRVVVDRSLEQTVAHDLRHLHLLVWDPQQDALLEVAFPYWFVRVKMTESLNLGTLTTALSGDWDHLDLRVGIDELRRRGPGVVLDHTRSDGVRLFLWNEAR